MALETVAAANLPQYVQSNILKDRSMYMCENRVRIWIERLLQRKKS
jgi:hypothetical protein